MKIETEIVYPAGTARVSAMTFTRDFQARKCAATGALSYEIDIVPTGSGARISTRRTMPTDQFPSFVRSMVGASIIVTEVDEWRDEAADGGRSGTITVEISGAPLKLTGTLTLRPTPGGSVAVIDADLRASVPFLGPRLESAAAPAILAAVRAEQSVAETWLAES